MTAVKNSSFAKAEMLIRKPVSEVFQAFINPAITTQFWFTKSSGSLVEGSEVQWTWEMYGHNESVSVKKIEPNLMIVIEWGSDADRSIVKWSFEEMSDNATFISITNDGFTGDTDKIIAQVRDSTEGFTLVLAGLKALLEHNIQLNLVGDRFPKGIAASNTQ